MKATVRRTRARTKREAIVAAITDLNGRRRMAQLARRAGSCSGLMTVDELQRLRRRGLAMLLDTPSRIASGNEAGQ